MRSTSRGVDYDRIAPLYDEPGRDYEADADLKEYLRGLQQSSLAAVRVLDMGCGTGKQLSADQALLSGSQLVGLDLFGGMLRCASHRSPSVSWVQGDNSYSPFVDKSFDFITNQFSYHHVLDKGALLAEASRVLRPGGRLVITNLDPWSMTGWVLYRYFPAAWDRDAADFLQVPELVEALERLGFTDIRTCREQNPREERLGDFLAYALDRHRTSQLMAITDGEYEAGINALQSHIRELGEQARVPSTTCVVRVTADKPG